MHPSPSDLFTKLSALIDPGRLHTDTHGVSKPKESHQIIGPGKHQGFSDRAGATEDVENTKMHFQWHNQLGNNPHFVVVHMS